MTTTRRLLGGRWPNMARVEPVTCKSKLHDFICSTTGDHGRKTCLMSQNICLRNPDPESSNAPKIRSARSSLYGGPEFLSSSSDPANL